MSASNDGKSASGANNVAGRKDTTSSANSDRGRYDTKSYREALLQG